MNLAGIMRLTKIVCQDHTDKHFVPLLEADGVGYLYHLLVLEEPSIVPILHLDSRVVGSRKNQKVDIVFGAIERFEPERPAIQPEAIIEVKVFPEGFTDQQHRVHLEHVLNDDIPKLSQIQCPVKVQLLFDQVDYFAGSYHSEKRLDAIIRVRDNVDKSICVIATFHRNGTLMAGQY